MAQIGAGSGTGYPGAVDTAQTWQNGASADVDSPTRLDAEALNDLALATVAIETELGADPAGAYASVRQRLDAMDTTVAGVGDAANITYQPAGGGATSASVQAFLRRFPTARDFGAVGDGVTDDTAAFGLANTAGVFTVTPGTYLISSNLTLTRALHLPQDGAVLKPASGVTLTLNGPIIAGNYQIVDLSGGGTLRYNNQPYFNVLWTGADQTGTDDSTDAWNHATQFDRAWSDIAAFYTEIIVPGGIYRLDGTVYVRAGQHLRGVGWGGTRINGTATPTNHMIRMGVGLIGAIETGDNVGTFPEVSGLIVRGFGGGTTWAAIENSYPGARIHNCTLSSTSVGILARGNDLIINNIQIDSTFLTGMLFQDINQATVSDVYTFTGNFPIRFGNNCNDVLINNLNTAYAEFAHVSLDDAADDIHNIRINNWTATMNQQHATFLGFLHSRAAEAEVHVNGFSMRNMFGPAINVASGFGTRMYLSNGSIDAARTRDDYFQSTTGAGIVASNAEVILRDVEFRGLAGQAITVGGTGTTTVVWSGGRSVASGVTPLILITNTNGASSVTLSNIIGEGKNLYNAQAIVNVHHMGTLTRWFADPVESGIRFFIPLPYQRVTVWEVTVIANVNSGGGGDYRKQATYLVSKRNDFSAGAKSYVEMFELGQDAQTDASWPQIDVQAEFNGVGGGTNIAESDSGLIVLTVPDTYTNLSFTVRQVASSV